MTAHMRSTPHASALPASQTAPVAEFRCLFTHDVRRKQKRWQDGYLKFHTFNNRVMVSDQARNHIGDTYWKESNELQEGDELSLDKGVLVEVAEATGITQTNLAPLFDWKTKDGAKELPPARPTPSAPKPFQRPSTVVPSNVPQTGTQLRHKSLNTLLGTPKGPVGKAQSMKSPYEARADKENENENEVVAERAPKRQKTAQRPGGWRASSPVQGEESPSAKSTPLWAKTSDAKTVRAPQARMPPVSKAITISSESDQVPVFTSDVTLPGTPAKVAMLTSKPPATSAPIVQSSIVDELEPEPVETPKPRPTKIRLPKPKPMETPKRPAPNSSPPVSASNHLTNVDFDVQPVQSVQKSPKKPTKTPSLPQNSRAKLRLSTGVKRGTLLCQSLPQTTRAGSESRASGSRPSVVRKSQIASKEPPPHDAENPVAQAETLPRLKTSPPFKDTRKVQKAEATGSKRWAKTVAPALESSEDVFDDPELIHGLMDQQLLVPSSPVEPMHTRISPPPKPSSPKLVATKPAPRKKRKATKDAQTDAEPDSVEASTTKSAPKKVPPVKKPTQKQRTSRPASPPADPILEPPAPPPKDISPTHPSPSLLPSRPSKSPTKPLVSTGGFCKKPKRTIKDSPAPSIPTDPPRNVSVPLPKGPLISTTALASLLQKRSRKRDPIEECSQVNGTEGKGRKIRRVRSENDKDGPIPSTAEDWEKRNLPKGSSNVQEGEGDGDVLQEPVVRKKLGGLAALVKKTDPRKRFVRARSAGVETGGLSEGGGLGIAVGSGMDGMGEIEVDLPSPVIDRDVGPWSTEAGDLFDWRPPGRERVRVGEGRMW